ncbi:MAG: nitrous oxide reductase accessory protein NosL [Polyangiaceae bacterium]
MSIDRSKSAGRRHFLGTSAALAMGAFVGLAGATTTAGCKREERCKRCGMVIDPTSRWLAEIREGDQVLARYDTPKCALFASRSGKQAGTVYLRGYYTQKVMALSDVVLATGSDVIGPMGADLIPIEPEHGTRFKNEHAARVVLKPNELTDDLVDDPK